MIALWVQTSRTILGRIAPIMRVVRDAAAGDPDMAEQSKSLLERFRAMEPWLVNGRVHAPFWEVHAARID